MRKIIAYLALSLDNYIATLDESVAWLDEVEIEGDAGYKELYDSIDTVVMGWNTYDWICNHASEYLYQDKISYVVTHKEIADNEFVHFTDDILTLLEEQKGLAGKDIWIVGGGTLISHLINHQCIDELRLTIAPILLGTGIPLFNDLKQVEKLVLEKTTNYGQFVELRYRFKKAAT